MRGFQRDACCGVAQLVVVHLLELLNVLSLVRGSRSAISKTMRLLYDTTVAVMGRAASQVCPLPNKKTYNILTADAAMEPLLL